MRSILTKMALVAGIVGGAVASLDPNITRKLLRS